MFKRISMALAIVLVLTLVLAINIPIVAARDAEVPFKATYQGIPVGVYDPTCTCVRQTYNFHGVATHLGEGRMTAAGKGIPGAPIVQDGEGTLIADNGDLLYWKYEGFGMYLPTGDVEFWGNYSITDGTGRFVGVTGTGTYWGSATPNVKGIIYLEGKLFK